jgi:hypothetical protein
MNYDDKKRRRNEPPPCPEYTQTKHHIVRTSAGYRVDPRFDVMILSPWVAKTACAMQNGEIMYKPLHIFPSRVVVAKSLLMHAHNTPLPIRGRL